MCDHKRDLWVEDEEDGHWEEQRTFEDVDLHRYRCTMCGQIFYYSERARRFYEDGEGELP